MRPLALSAVPDRRSVVIFPAIRADQVTMSPLPSAAKHRQRRDRTVEREICQVRIGNSLAMNSNFPNSACNPPNLEQRSGATV